VRPELELVLSDHYGVLAPDHRADLDRSGLTEATTTAQRIRSVPPAMMARLLGFDPAAVVSAYLIPFADPRGGWMDHVRMKVFPSYRDAHGQTVKYLQPRRSGVRIYFPVATVDAVLHAADPLYLVEGEKKALAVAQTGLPAVGLCGIEGWHVGGSSALHPDLDDVGMTGRILNVIPDADYRTNPAVERAVRGLAHACTARGAASVRIILVPAGSKGIDDYLVRP
jgi:hypothetical protein